MMGHRKRFLQKILDQMDHCEPVDILEFILFIANTRKNTRPIARMLIEKYGTLSSICAAPREELMQIEGLGEFSYCLLSALFQICTRMLKERVIRHSLCIEDLVKHVLFLTQEKKHEVLYVAMIDIQNRVRNVEMVAQGENACVQIHITQLIRLILNQEPHGIILIHNHPSGNLQPSNDDIETTKKIRRILANFHIHVHDSLIINYRGEVCSLSQRNLI